MAVSAGVPAYDYWLFDFDGTLVDTDWTYARRVFDRIGETLGREFTDAEAERLWHGYGGLRDDQLRMWDIDPPAFWEALRDAEEPDSRAAFTRLYDDAAVIAQIDVPVGIVTHCQPYLLEPVLESLGIRHWFDVVVSCSDDIGWKPDPLPVYSAMNGLRVTQTHAGVLVGDGPHDIGAAWNAGLDAIHVERHGPTKRRQCVLGDYRVNTLSELSI